jgi:D-serine deaminase-like pyridoxal phosphate-dependent protein
MRAPRDAYQRWRDILTDEPLPAAVVDLDAVDANLETLRSALGPGPVTLRVASKSIRHHWLLKHLVATGGDRFRGLMTFSAHEAVFLSEQGFDDFLMGYPLGRIDEALALAGLAEKGMTAIATVNASDHVTLLASAAAELGVEIPVCIDVDVSWRPAGGRLHFGVRRSSIRAGDTARTLGREIANTKGVKLVAVLAYEAQIAGMQDHSRFERHLDPIKRLIKSRSKPAVARLRGEVVDGLRADGHDITVVNGGGTGSVRWTGQDPSVTEVTAGSGFLCSHLFDGYAGLDLVPAVFYALSVVRCSDPGFVTCAGGGYLASGPAAPDRAPRVHLPEGIEPLAMEGFGEVQTPFKLARGAPSLGLGDPVLCRHAKAGELAERFAEYIFVRGNEIVGREPTYRGAGQRFM